MPQEETIFSLVECFLAASSDELARLEVTVQNDRVRLTPKGLRELYRAYMRFLKRPEGLTTAEAVDRSPFLTAKIVSRAKRYLLTKANTALATQTAKAA